MIHIYLEYQLNPIMIHLLDYKLKEIMLTTLKIQNVKKIKHHT